MSSRSSVFEEQHKDLTEEFKLYKSEKEKVGDEMHIFARTIYLHRYSSSNETDMAFLTIQHNSSTRETNILPGEIESQNLQSNTTYIFKLNNTIVAQDKSIFFVMS